MFSERIQVVMMEISSCIDHRLGLISKHGLRILVWKREASNQLSMILERSAD
jgi:hypothetical protein